MEVLWGSTTPLYDVRPLLGLGDDLTSLEFNQYLKLVKDYHLADPNRRRQAVRS